jgi:small subunit ribosomal protein S1
MVIHPSSDESVDMAQLLDEAESNYQTLQRGEVVDGIIMKVDRDGLLVNVGQKTEGVVPGREMRSLAPENIDTLAVGDNILVAVVRPETDEGQAILSLDRARGEQSWRKLQDWSEEGRVLEAPVTGYNKGGAIVSVEGLQAFVPLSQLSSVPRTPPGSEENEALVALVGSNLRLKVIEVNRKRNRAILSERAAVQEQRQVQKAKLLDELMEGEVREGRVSGITNFGVFVDLGGADGLIHISELSWESVRSPEDVVQVGDVLDVWIIKVDREAKRIALSLKRTKPEPWVEIGVRYQVGQVVPATITKLASFGAFARIDGVIEGLIHISELSDRVIGHPKEVVREGDPVNVKIVKMDPDRRRIGLSLKQVEEVDVERPQPAYAPQPEGDHRIEQGVLNPEMAARLARAVSEADGANANGAAEEGANGHIEEIPDSEEDGS